MSRTVENIWYKDPIAYLLDTEAILFFIPNPKSSIEAQLNDALRFSIYFGILVAILRKDARALFFPIFVAFFTIFIYSQQSKKVAIRDKLLEKLNVGENKRNNKLCTTPTQSNPFMNVLISDYNEFPNKPPACDTQNKTTKQLVGKYAKQGLSSDADDIFNKQPLDIQFHTMPSTTIPNSQSDFANWLYNPGRTFKEDGVTSFEWR